MSVLSDLIMDFFFRLKTGDPKKENTVLYDIVRYYSLHTPQHQPHPPFLRLQETTPLTETIQNTAYFIY